MCRELLLVIFTSVFLVSSCTKDNFCAFILPTDLSALRMDGGVVLDFEPNFVLDFVGEPCEPDGIEIYRSEDNEEFTFVQSVNFETKTIPISSLMNNRPYYFKTITKKGEEEAAISEPIMIIPKDLESLEFTNQDFDYEIEQFEYSDDGQFILFSDYRDRWFYVDVNNPGVKRSFRPDVARAKWVLGGQSIVYSTEFVDRSSSVNFIYDSGI